MSEVIIGIARARSRIAMGTPNIEINHEYQGKYAKNTNPGPKLR